MTTFYVKQVVCSERWIMVSGDNAKDAEQRANDGYGEVINAKEFELSEYGPRKRWLLTSTAMPALDDE